MLPRPLITSTFGLFYRRIPILAIGRHIYCDTSLIIEALEHFFPADQGWGTVYPEAQGLGGGEWAYRAMARGFAGFWTDVSVLWSRCLVLMSEREQEGEVCGRCGDDVLI